ncbi:hypothetical protein PG991_011811 [Apiospora marii]|uniref:Fungal-type protein kinase domain-containing protein n=1 Tax=Apiospora marii TaxID=335849 RepID=A0ABR1RFL0_9PEZI
MATSQNLPQNGVEEEFRSGLNFTISQLLGRANPEFRSRALKSKPSKNDDWVQISADHITKLDGFTSANLGLMFEDLLEQRVTLTPLEVIGLGATSIGGERAGLWNDLLNLNHCLQSWVEANACLCINKTVARLQDRLGIPQKTYGLAAQFRRYRPFSMIGQRSGQKKYLHANWLVAWPGRWIPDGVDLVGQLKSPTHFDPTDVAFINPADGDEWEEPPAEIAAASWCLRQCGTYAWQAECRYMFLVTVEYVTVLRFYLVEGGGEEDLAISTVLGVEYDYFPYSRHGERELSLCKTVWALTLMAQHPRHRDIVPRRRMLPLNTWYSYTTAAEGRTYYVHHLSEIIRDSIPGNEPKIIDISKARDEDLIQRIALRVGEAGR